MGFKLVLPSIWSIMFFLKGWFDSRLVLYVNLYFLLLVISVIFSVLK